MSKHCLVKRIEKMIIRLQYWYTTTVYYTGIIFLRSHSPNWLARINASIGRQMTGGGQTAEIVAVWREGRRFDSYHRSTSPLGNPLPAAAPVLKNDVVMSLIKEVKGKK